MKYYYRIVSISFDNPGFRRQTELLSFTVYNETNVSGSEVIKLFNSNLLSMEFFLLINVKTATIVGTLTFNQDKYSILKIVILVLMSSLNFM